MLQEDSIVKVLIPNEVNNGFDYRLSASASIGDFVSVSVSNKIFNGLVIGAGDGNVPADKIKSTIAHHGFSLPVATVEWIKKMSDWTMMPMGAILKLMTSAADFKEPKRPHQTVKYFDTCKVCLNAEQQAAADSIDLEKFNVHLLDGITGSGKTQVYFNAAMRAYESGKSVLLMVPEIALTTQFLSRFEERFGARPTEWHSSLTPAKRRHVWHGVLDGHIKIVVGTRSALFLPWQDLGLIVIDEEHDGSYKQEDMGNYHARDMAVLLAKTSNIPVVLASATPSFETIRNVQIGKYKESKLTARFGGAKLPKIEIVDMRRNAGSKNADI